ncbi:unnamed protein product [Bemisia tabaci]|uniref:DNA/RNA non-specific endonuclease/pyrophosphatase/phosphodiesterase domain-containing protein n=1 Tax=Bemisia tabaci TaxID=7038 RepID=A0A9P0EYG6_BEMTA|nr:unnamed protein product [Bemisia tabaci]
MAITFSLAFLVLLKLLSPQRYVKTACKISLRDDLPVKEPLYLKRFNGSLEFVLPLEDKTIPQKDRGVLELAKNEELILACPGKNNELMSPPYDVVESHCVDGKRLDVEVGGVGNKTLRIEQLECANSVRAVLRPNFSQTCAKTGTEMEIGFEVETEYLPLINVCHDVDAADTIYVEHDIVSTIRGAKMLQNRPSFQEGPYPLYDGVNTRKVYTQEYQRQLFDDLLGKGEGKHVIRGLYYLAKGHLAPHADFLYGTWKWATYFYVNAAPQWQIINGGNWKGLEDYLKRLAAETGEDLHIITGSWGVLKLRSRITGTYVDVYLQPEEGHRKIRVPAGFFKIIQSKVSHKAIVAICSNNPFEKVPLFSLCKNIAKENHWPTAETRWKSYKRGFIYFCNVEQFVARVKEYLPKVKYSGILQGLEK